MTAKAKTVGRYAPSPTGALHIGNLRTALLAWLHARVQGGDFFLRIEDLDTPRTVVGSADQILRDLEWLGIDWDGEVVYQSSRTDRYQDALSQLTSRGLVYECFCSRKDIQQAASAPHTGHGVYPGFCAELSEQVLTANRKIKVPAMRVRVTKEVISFNDGCVGARQASLQESCGDFVIKRADGLFAYQLAVVVDDLAQGITDVVRGADLIDSTARQIYLAKILGAREALPNYWHVPLMLDEHGARMAKRDGSMSVAEWCDSGGNHQELLGLLACSVGLVEQPDAISQSELLSQLTLPQWVAATSNDVTHPPD